jgi:hypothetical protein
MKLICEFCIDDRMHLKTIKLIYYVRRFILENGREFLQSIGLAAFTFDLDKNKGVRE